jgi:hypothetical protein
MGHVVFALPLGEVDQRHTLITSEPAEAVDERRLIGSSSADDANR